MIGSNGFLRLDCAWYDPGGKPFPEMSLSSEGRNSFSAPFCELGKADLKVGERRFGLWKAHELNNPLAGLRSLAQVLRQDQRYPESVKSDLQEIEKAAERSSAIIRDLMEFSSAEYKPREFVSLNQVTESALNMLKTALHDHGVETQFAEDSDVQVLLEPHLMQHVIFNIVNNACQAMRESGRIEIETKREAGKAVLEIRDTGPGIPDEILARIFEPFFTTKGAGQGTGLGLSMSRWVVESFDGKIQAYNRSSPRGAVFRIELPVGERVS